ncbi:MAG: 4-amino-4-deoxy-L-arabinose transferase, partial [Flavobacteriaceae bacterium]
NQYSIDSSESRVQHKKILYVSKYIPERDIWYSRANGDTLYAKFIDDFESFRELRCFIDKPLPSKPFEKYLRLKVFNPYSMDIDLKKIKFGVAYLNAYKEKRDIQPITELHQEKNILSLKSNDTTYFTFKLPKSEMIDPEYIKLGISENGLDYGLNGENLKIE